jgi:hypothetical protein
MKYQAKLTSNQQEQIKNDLQNAGAQHAQQPLVHEFATPEEMLRHDALHTPVPPAIAFRLSGSIGQTPLRNQPWWRRLLGGSNR